MKKRLLLAVLFSVAAGGMLYQMSWSQRPTLPVVDDPAKPVEAPGEDIIWWGTTTGCNCSSSC